MQKTKENRGNIANYCQQNKEAETQTLNLNQADDRYVETTGRFSLTGKIITDKYAEKCEFIRKRERETGRVPECIQ